mmetsp:Transcript_92452/g.193274  ORF Transcript_92452/g.193274 Transcript_92452/m.193274 type:complete len:96 (-) Transcript_92452:1185-1472(-)
MRRRLTINTYQGDQEQWRNFVALCRMVRTMGLHELQLRHSSARTMLEVTTATKHALQRRQSAVVCAGSESVKCTEVLVTTDESSSRCCRSLRDRG